MCVAIAYTCRAGPGRAMRTGTTRKALAKPAVGRAGTNLLVSDGRAGTKPGGVREQSVPGQLSPVLKAAVILSEYFTRFYHLELLSFHLRIKYTKN